MTHPRLELRAISKSFFGIPAVKEVSFSLEPAQILGLIGENGAGKSTLMNILGGVHQPDAGTMSIDGEPYAPAGSADAGGARIAFIHQELNLFTNLTIAENMFIGKFPRLAGLPLIDRRAMREKTKAVLVSVGLDVSPDEKIERLAPGERQLIEIGKAVLADAQIVILDEPTTSLTQREKERLFAILSRMREEGRSLIFISHVLADVLRLSDPILVLRDGAVVSQAPTEEMNTQKMIAMMVGRDIGHLFPERAGQSGSETLLAVSGISQPGIVHKASLDVHRGEIVGLFGLMGSGRTELARAIFGLDPHLSGSVKLNGTDLVGLTPRQRIERGLAFVTEDRRDEGLLMDREVIENLGLVSLANFGNVIGALDIGKMREASQDAASSLKLKVSDPRLLQPVRSLSGGNQQKVVIGKWVMNDPSVLIMDEPTRGIDVGARYEVFSIINGLADRGAGILCISSELEELTGICDRILVMHNGEIVKAFARVDFEVEALLAAAFGMENAA